ncbi:MAG TPA: hypothetical protein DGG95_15405, partial [Cytophagales bacterium]|nr:hypothetical protein [Cytophagales bacterium]
MLKQFLFIALLSLVACKQDSKKTAWEISSPAENQYTHIDYQGTTVIPNGRLLTPFGKQVLLAPHP